VSLLSSDPPATTVSPASEQSFLPDIEGLRAISIIAVVLYHANVGWASGGYVGVDVFFVISGYLITGLLLREHSTNGRVSLVGFYGRRARRILPAGMLVLVLTVVAAYFMLNFISFGSVAQDGRWAALFAANFHFAIQGSSYFGNTPGNGPSPLQHYWSLAVEEQFYFVWPAVIITIGLTLRQMNIRTKILIAAIAVTAASFVWSVIQTGTDATWAYYSPLTRGWELGVGAILATIPLSGWARGREKIAVSWLGLAAIVVAVLIFTQHTSYPGFSALLPVLGAAAVIAAGANHRGANVALSSPPMRSVGRVSYGWYLLHYPPMILLVGPVWTYPLSTTENLVIGACTLVAAYGMYYLIEHPIRRARILARRPWLSVGMGAALVVSAFLLCALLQKSLFDYTWHH
jgi:peptidoglycan/LPS O-acetylase OafA/YrhL